MQTDGVLPDTPSAEDCGAAPAYRTCDALSHDTA